MAARQYCRTLFSITSIGVLLLFAAMPATADDSTASSETSQIVDSDTVVASDFVAASPATEADLTDSFMEESASEGTLVDQAEVVVEKVPDVGFVVGTATTMDDVLSATRIESNVYDGSNIVAEELELSLAQSGPEPSAAAELPLGPGSLGIHWLTQDPCSFFYGDDSNGNWISACNTLGYLDGGDGRHAYNVSDDDTSSKYDWFTYHQWGTVHPSDSGVDWLIQKGSKMSIINPNNVDNGDPGITDYAPNAASCDGALSMGPWSFDFGGSLCVDGTEIDLQGSEGSFGQHLEFLIAPVNSKSLNYRIAIRIKQGVKPDWTTFNEAKFRKQFTLNNDQTSGQSS